MKKLKLDQIIKLHEMLLKETGGIPGLRDVSLLESAINSPFQTFDKVSLYPTLERKAARLGYGIVKNHRYILYILLFLRWELLQWHHLRYCHQLGKSQAELRELFIIHQP